MENPEGGREAGRAQRSAALNAGRDLAGDPPGTTETQWMQRRGEATAGAGDDDRGFDAGATPVLSGGPVAQAAAAPPSLSAWTALTPAEVAYARRYLGGMEKDQ